MTVRTRALNRAWDELISQHLPFFKKKKHACKKKNGTKQNEHHNLSQS